jgi:hypothetical protein
MPLKRTAHWATREFSQFLSAQAKTPFAWGTNDCCLFPADAILAFTGHDLAAAFRGEYTTEAEALALIKSVTGGTTVEDAAAWCAKEAGLAEWADKNGKPLPLFAQRGDLVVLANGGNLIAGVVHLNGHHVISVGSGGLLRLPLRSAKRAWKV